MDPAAEDVYTQKDFPNMLSRWLEASVSGGCKPAERNYSPIEGEATALFKGLQDTKYYTLGCKKLCTATDKQPLVTTLAKQLSDDVSNKCIVWDDLRDQKTPFGRAVLTKSMIQLDRLG